MAPVDHPVSGSALVFSLAGEMQRIRDELAGSGARTARTARTLVKEGALRLTLVGIRPGGELRTHHADGPISVHVLEGEIEFHAGGERWTLAAGSLLSLPARVEHAVQSPQGGIFLLAVASPGMP
ncbi:MAG: cupin domain-containing protein [Gemmatimonadaceae bacterium]|nr:cupin domain-containing protein [Gemmatimonadaceae bacterium]